MGPFIREFVGAQLICEGRSPPGPIAGYGLAPVPGKFWNWNPACSFWRTYQ